jgi:hypothetical protein
VLAHKTALEATNDKQSVAWATTQDALGAARREQGLLHEGAEAYDRALQVFTELEHPKEWGATQNNRAAVFV